MLLTVLPKFLTVRPVLLNFITMSVAFPQCFDTVGWVTGMVSGNTIWHVDNLTPTIPPPKKKSWNIYGRQA